jgi:hypothetical protein
MSRAVPTFLVLVALVGAASADPPRAKRRDVAILLALGGTIAPFVLAAPATSSEHPSNLAIGFAAAGGVALVAAPSAGHWYAGTPVTWGLGMRVVGAALIAGMIYVAHEHDCRTCGFEMGPALGTIAGGALVMSGAIADIVTAGRAVDRWNSAHGAIDVTPTAMAIGGGYGIGVVGRF